MTQSSLADFAGKLRDIMPEIIRAFLRRETNELSKGKITVPQFFVLNYLSRKNELRMTDIAQFLQVSTAAATGIVERLVKCGYVSRVYEPQDRRIIKIRLTNKGSVLVQKVNQQKEQSIIEIFGKMSESERNDYLRILLRIHEIVTQENAGVKTAE